MSRLEMLTPQNSAIALIDYQPAMYQGVQSHDRLVTFNNIQILAKAARLFRIPTVLTTVAKDSFSGPFMPEVTELFPKHDIIDRTSMNSWLDAGFRKAVTATGRKESRHRRPLDRGLRDVPDPRYAEGRLRDLHPSRCLW